MNYLENAQTEIDDFASDNSELTQEFAIKLSQQLQGLFRDDWDSETHTKEDVLMMVLEEDDVLQKFCYDNDIDMQNEDGDTDFDVHYARDLQHMIIDAVAEFFELE